MEISTEYEIGQHIWIVNIHDDVVTLFDDYIAGIIYNEAEGVIYTLEEAELEEVYEADIIAFEDDEKLLEMLKTTMFKIRHDQKTAMDEAIRSGKYDE